MFGSGNGGMIQSGSGRARKPNRESGVSPVIDERHVAACGLDHRPAGQDAVKVGRRDAAV